MARPTVLWDTVVPSKQIHLMENFKDTTARLSAPGFDISNAVDYRTYSLWKAPDTGLQQILINGIGDAGATTAFPVDSIGIANHNLGSLGLEVRIYSTTDSSVFNPTWTQRAVFSPADDLPVFVLFNSTTAQYWRIQIQASGAGFPQIGLLYFGTKTVMVDNFSPSVDPRVIVPLFSKGLRNQQGHTIPSAARTLLRDFDFRLEPVGSLKADHISILDPLVAHVRKLRPFFFDYNTDDTLFSPMVLRLANGEIARPFVSGNYARMGLNFKVTNATPEDV